MLPDADLDLGIRGVAAELVVRVTERLADRVDADEGASGEVVLAGDVALAHRIDLRPLGVGVIRQEFGRVDLVLGVAVRGLLGILERHRGRCHRLKALNGVVSVVGQRLGIVVVAHARVVVNSVVRVVILIGLIDIVPVAIVHVAVAAINTGRVPLLVQNVVVAVKVIVVREALVTLLQ